MDQEGGGLVVQGEVVQEAEQGSEAVNSCNCYLILHNWSQVAPEAKHRSLELTQGTEGGVLEIKSPGFFLCW